MPDSLGITWSEAATVVVATVGIYLTLLALIRVVGQRALATMSSFDFAAAVALGAVLGRVVLGHTPTLAAGALGLATLFALQAFFGQLRRVRPIDRAISNLPLLLMADGKVIEKHLRRAHITEDELREKLRLGGVRRYEDVTALILERTGQFSILRRGETIAADMLSDVRGCEALSQEALDEGPELPLT
jgi:uncharacterized membrane protein YcaP (DUF421 family)